MKAIPDLLKALKDEHSYVCMEAARALGRLGSDKAIPGVLKTLKHEDPSVHRSAAKALKQIINVADACILPQLIALIPTPSGEAVFNAMLAIQNRCKFYNYDITHLSQSMKIFFSYAHKDEPLRDQLATHLSQLKRDRIITDWHDRNITAGTDWAQAIDHNLNAADIILLLISSDFLASDYCYNIEMQRAIERHHHGTARVIPIILRPCDWHSAPFGKL